MRAQRHKPITATVSVPFRQIKSMAAANSSLVVVALALLVLAHLTPPASSCPPSDRAALLAFKSALHEPFLNLFASWTGPNCCRGWYGVACDPTTSRVVDINLRGESEDPILQKAHRSGFMSGRISSFICRLNHLTTLILADWKNITGPIPSCIASSLPFLRTLDLIGNRLSGPLPPNIGRLTHLTVINVADNLISGVIPPSINNLAALKHLDLRNNRISGPIPAHFGNLRMVSRALFGRNMISGQIPTSIAGMDRLSDLDLSANRISGPIPAWVGNMPVLASLYLDQNLLSGRIPASLVGSRGLSILNLSRNALEGSIPDVFGERSYFMELDLAYNKLTGRVPLSLTKAAYIGHLDLSHNRLCGRIPPLLSPATPVYAERRCLSADQLRFGLHADAMLSSIDIKITPRPLPHLDTLTGLCLAVKARLRCSDEIKLSQVDDDRLLIYVETCTWRGRYVKRGQQNTAMNITWSCSRWAMAQAVKGFAKLTLVLECSGTKTGVDQGLFGVVVKIRHRPHACARRLRRASLDDSSANQAPNQEHSMLHVGIEEEIKYATSLIKQLLLNVTCHETL
ncbi:hypothetical protein ACLOJK_020312 [Asimina triloba]